MKVRIKPNAMIARLAAKRLKTQRVAIVIGKTIYLHNVSAKDFLNDSKWLRHEATHIKQFQRYGFVRFLFLYLKESWKNGYEKNRFETEPRENEKDENILKGIEFKFPSPVERD